MSQEKVNRIHKITLHGVYGFFGDHRFLSNYHEVPIEYEGLTYRSTEAAYQAAKSIFPDYRIPFTTMGPGTSKKEGQKILLRADWNEVKLQVMYDLLLYKFTQHEDLQVLLLLTGDKYLEETNWWKDTYWGVCDEVGENHLGKTLMKIRDQIKNYPENL